ncbi:MAG: hypothetical protein WD042_17015 [Phycisphaeraceae bacterium]
MLRCRDRYPDRFLPGYCPHPCLGDAPALFEAAVRMHGAFLDTLPLVAATRDAIMSGNALRLVPYNAPHLESILNLLSP